MVLYETRMTSTANPGPVPKVDDVLITAELANRPSRPPDYERENGALGLLAQEMAAHPRGVLQKCAELVVELCHADSAGISILEPEGAGGVLRWCAAAGAFAPNLHGTMPAEASPCGTVMERNCVLLFDKAERFFPTLRGVEPRIYENLLTPWHAEGKAVGTLWAIKHTPDGRFDAEDARILQSLARFAAAAFQITSALDEAAVERSALRESEQKFRTLFEEMDEGFAVCELVRDDAGHPVDFRYIDLNPSIVHHTGMAPETLRGRRATEAFPGRDHWYVETYAQVVDSGQSVLEEHYFEHVDRWLRINVFPRGGDRFAVLYSDITDRKRVEIVLRQSEQRQAFLLRFTDAIRSESDEQALIKRAIQLLAEELLVDRCYATRHNPTADLTNVLCEVRAPDMAPLPATLRFTDFPEAGRHTFEKTLVYDDTANDPTLSEADKVALKSMGVAALLSRPLRRDGAPIFALGVTSKVPRRWTSAEIALVEEAAERAWEAAERVRGEGALRNSEERFRQFADASAAGLWIREANSLDMEFASPAIAAIYGVQPDALLGDVKRWAVMVVPDDRDEAVACLEAARTGQTVVHEFRIKRSSDGAFRWIRNTDFPLEDATGQFQRIGGIAEDVTEAKLAVDHQGVLLLELQHRVRNIMAMIRSMTRRSADGAADVNEYGNLLEGRLLALARVQALLTRQVNTGGSLRDIVESEVSAQASGGGQYELVGPDVQLSPKAVEVLTLALHELSTNALKYGALSVPKGRLRVEWAPFEKRGRTWLAIDWAEAGAPARGPVTRRGFGSDLIEGRIPYELGGTGRLGIEPGGACCRLEFPLKEGESILETDAPTPTAVFGGTLDMTGAPDLTGCNVLVVEDDYYIAGDTAAALRGAGATVLGPCPNEDATLDLLKTATPTHAVLDLNLGGGGPRFAIAHALKERGVPFIFLTGYDPDAVPADLAEVVRLQKPVPLSNIVKAVALL